MIGLKCSRAEIAIPYQMIQDLIPNDPTHLEALLAGDRVDDHVAVDADEVFAVEDGVLVLPGRVDDLHAEVLVTVAHDFGEGVFDGWVVRLHEVAVHVLHGQGRFAYTRSVRQPLLCFRFTPDETGEASDVLIFTYQLIDYRQWPSCAVSAAAPWLIRLMSGQLTVYRSDKL